MRKIISVLMILLLCSGCAKTAAPRQRMYGIWVATTQNLDFPSRSGLDGREIKNEIRSICHNCQDWGINAIFLQVRANADAIYNHSVFGASEAVYGTRNPQKTLGFDILEEFILTAHQAGIQLYAWINPYRISGGESQEVLESLPPDHPAKKNPELIMPYSGGVALNPGIPQTTEIILTGIREIAEQYDVDGIVFDDYFYPYDGGYDDSTAYAKYGANFKSVEDFRRYSVNHMVQSCSQYLKNKNIPFGISPFGIWDNGTEYSDGSKTNGLSSYREIYADSRLWVEQNWVDFIAPQLYWSFENEKAPFETLFLWWENLCRQNNVRFYAAHYVSRIGSGLAGWDSEEQIKRQLDLCEQKNFCEGSIFFRYQDFLKNEYNEQNILKNRTDNK